MTLTIPHAPVLSISEDSSEDSLRKKYDQFPIPKLLNRHTRAKLSSTAFDSDFPAARRLLVVANEKRWFAAVVAKDNQFALAASPTEALHSAALGRSELSPQRILPLDSAPISIALASHETHLLVAFTNRIIIYETALLFTPGQSAVAPTKELSISHAIKQLVSYGGPTIAVVCAEDTVEVLDVGSATLRPVPTPAVSASWSPSGTQLGLGRPDGEIVIINDSLTEAFRIPSAITNKLIHLTWINDFAFHVVSGDSQDVQHAVVEAKSDGSLLSCFDLTAPFLDREVVAPYTPVLGRASDSPCLIIGDLASDGFEVASKVDGQWCQRSAETPMQIAYADEGTNVLLGLELDLTDTESLPVDVSGEKVDFPPPPILLAYLSDGTIQAWHLALRNPPPEMTASKTEPDQSMQAESTTESQPVLEQPSIPSSSVFGKPAEQSSTLNSGFGAFAPQGPSKFGQTGFGFGVSQPEMKVSPTNEDSGLESAMEGMFSSGPAAASPTASPPAAAAGGMFGSLPTFGAPSTTPTSSPLKPASGFGAFSQFASNGPSAFGAKALPSTSAFGSSGSFSQPQTPTTPAFGQPSFGSVAQPAFGQSSFGGTSATPAFGQSSFGTAPAFGQSSFGAAPTFGQSSFGASVTPAKAPSTGGFGAFASASTSSFASAAKDKEKASASMEGFGSFARTSPSAFGAATASSPFGQTVQKVATNESVDRSTQRVESPPITPIREPVTPDMSPSPSPPPPSTPPPPKPSAPAPSGGAFGSLTTQKSQFGSFGGSSAFLKPATGFGAFGQPSTEASPFYSPKKDASPSTSAFGAKSAFGPASATATTPSASPFGQSPAAISAPTFGSPSALGLPKSVFGGESTTPKFGTPSALGPPKSVFSLPTTPSPATSPSPSNASAFSGYAGGFGSVPSSGKSFSELLKGESAKATLTKGKSPEPKTSTSPTPVAKDKEIPKAEEKEVDPASETKPSDEEEAEDSDEGEVIVSEPEDSGSEDEGPDAESFLSDSDEEEGEEEESESEESESGSEESDEPGVDKAKVLSKGIGKGKKANDKTTTPPGSPSKPSEPAVKPLSAFASTTPSPFGKTFGRSSTKPTRSSPLTSAPVSGEDEEDSTVKVKSEPISPSPSFVVSKPIAVVPLKDNVKKESNEADSAIKRPKTPPLLSSLFPSKSSDAIPQKPSVPEVKESIFKPPQATTPSPSPSPVLTPNQQPKAPSAFSFSPTPKPASASSSPIPGTPHSSIFSSALPSAPAAVPISGFGLLGKPAEAKEPSPPKAAEPPKPSFFGFGQPTVKLPVPPAAPSSTPSPFGAGLKPAAPESISSKPPQAPPSPASPPTFPNFPTKPPTASASPPSLFPNFPTKPSAAAPAPAPTQPPPQQSYESGLQSECVYLFSALAKELEDLRILAQDAVKKREAHIKMMQTAHSSLGLSRSQSSISLSSSNSGPMSTTVRSTVNSLEDMKKLRAGQRRDVQKLESEMLKAFTRKEEVARFKKAKIDGDFAKMLKVRTLGPEHQEVQTQLRRNIRTVRDRIQKLEGHLHSSKKRLMEYKTGRAGLRAPSLDTINRTCRNIDIAIEHQAEAIANLSARASAIKEQPSCRTRSPYQRDARLPDPISKPLNVTPHVAVVTAAALNAERSAQRFKSVLLKARKDPILNTTVTDTPKAPVNLNTPTKPPPSTAPLRSGDFSTMQFSDFGEDEFHVTTNLPGRHSEGRRNKTHNPPVARKIAGFPQPPPAPVSFDWGPLPTFGKK